MLCSAVMEVRRRDDMSELLKVRKVSFIVEFSH